ncbi:hypothetical protein [Agromyces sp. Soil535]|uniref:hypothetical protein n=1 Tax=Agromyces sp. Soil535 TaxID=1736390 RepID=UPI0006F9A851|nr:hypothetical protein [Agromyces sp. Soil535]KRE30219.1 hypothetical protein ASG80_18485 [Agromyces sp. Soil535]
MTEMNPAAQVPPGWHMEPATGRMRWWDGAAWGVYQQHVAPVGFVGPAAPTARNGFAVAALVLGIWGFVTTWIPLFIGLFFGGIPDILAIVFGILGVVRANRSGGQGMALAVIGLILGSLAFLSIFLGAGTIW